MVSTIAVYDGSGDKLRGGFRDRKEADEWAYDHRPYDVFTEDGEYVLTRVTEFEAKIEAGMIGGYVRRKKRKDLLVLWEVN